MPTPQKIQILQETSARLEGVRGVYLADFSGMNVESLSLLRKKCREQQIQFRVVKNTLLKRAFHERGITELDQRWVYSTYFERETGQSGALELQYRYAIMLVVEMDLAFIDMAPDYMGAAASAMGYSQQATAASSLAAYIRALGGAAGLHQDFQGPMAKPHRMAAIRRLLEDFRRAGGDPG